MAWNCKDRRRAGLGQLQSEVRISPLEWLNQSSKQTFRADALVHSVAVVHSSCLVYSASLAPAVSSVFATLRNGAKAFPTYCTGARRLGEEFVSGVPGTVDLDKERELQPVSEVPQVGYF